MKAIQLKKGETYRMRCGWTVEIIHEDWTHMRAFCGTARDENGKAMMAVCFFGNGKYNDQNAENQKDIVEHIKVKK